MTRQDRQLLIQDLCARLPYGVKAQYYCSEEEMLTVDTIEAIYTQPSVEIIIGQYGLEIEDIKPYLRPLSSMTEDEKVELLHTIVGKDGIKYFRVLSDGSIDNTDAAIQDLNKFNMHWVNFDKDTVTSYFDWLNQHHFDYRELIKKDLAISTEEFNPYK